MKNILEKIALYLINIKEENREQLIKKQKLLKKISKLNVKDYLRKEINMIF